MNNKRFNIRVYGILINERNELLVMDELIHDIAFTKFPGGGLEWGEGTIDCLHREFGEELGQPIEVEEHVYTTDYFQVSAFEARDQLMSIYYRVKLAGPQVFTAKTKPFDFPDRMGNPYEVPRWVPLEALSADAFRWPVDRLVARKLLQEWS